MGSNTSVFISKQRLSGSALAQCLHQLGGKEAADLDDTSHFKKCFNLLQDWIKNGYILSGHDVSDGGFLTTILESAFAGNCSVVCDINTTEKLSESEILKMLFSEELGLILEVDEILSFELIKKAHTHGINNIERIGKTLPIFGKDAKVIVI